MKRLTTFFSVVMLLLPHARGQQPITFDTVRFNQVGSFAIGHSVHQINGGFRVFSTQKGLAGLSQDIYVTDFDSVGGSISERTFETYQQDWFGRSSAVQETITGYYAAVARFGAIGPMDSLFLYKFDLAGDTVWTRFVDVDTTYTIGGLATGHRGNVLVAGLHEQPTEAYIYKLDSNGSVVAYHTYEDLDPNDIVCANTGIWYLAGMGYTSNYGRNVVLGSDTAGNELWRFTDLTQYCYTKSLIQLRDGSAVAIGTASQSSGPASCFAMKFAPDGSIIWEEYPWTSDQFNRPCQFMAGYEALDSTLVLAGWYRDGPVRDAGMIFKLDALGNTIWQRFYTHYPGAAYGKDQIFYDVKPTSDGGMVLTGETNSDAYPYAQLWLLKLDSMGCLVPGCQYVGLQEFTDAYVNAVTAYPNPSNGAFTLELDLPENAPITGDLLLQVFDMQGRQVLARGLGRDRYQRIALDLTNEPAGLYSAHLSDGKRILTGVRLVVE